MRLNSYSYCIAHLVSDSSALDFMHFFLVQEAYQAQLLLPILEVVSWETDGFAAGTSSNLVGNFLFLLAWHLFQELCLQFGLLFVNSVAGPISSV